MTTLKDYTRDLIMEILELDPKEIDEEIIEDKLDEFIQNIEQRLIEG